MTNRVRDLAGRAPAVYLVPEVAEMVYYGFWYTAKFDALLAFIQQAQRPVTGSVQLNLYKGNVMVAGREAALRAELEV